MAGARTYHARALVLDRTKLGETDLILTLLAQDGRQLRCVAKGARKPGGRLAARVELFCECDFLVARGRSLDVVSEAGLVDAHARLRGDLARVSAASAVCEVARLTCYEDAPDLKVCAHAGWRPVLDACCACGDPAPSRLSALAGGLLCESCARDVAGAEEVSPSQVAWLRALLGSTFDELLSAPVDDSCAAWLLGCAHVWCATHLEARLRAMEFALSV